MCPTDDEIMSAYLAKKPAQKAVPMDDEAIMSQYLAQKKAPKKQEFNGVGGGWDSVEGAVKGAGRAVLDGLLAAGKKLDSYTGAPTRAALEPVIDSFKESDSVDGRPSLLTEVPSRFLSQFGRDPELAPTGKKLAQKMGLPETTMSDQFPGMYSETGDELMKFKKGGLLDPTASGAAGLGIDVLADPTNYIPVGLIGKTATKTLGGAEKALNMATKPFTKSGEFIAKTVEKVAPTIAEMNTGIAKNNWKTYLDEAKQVEKNISKYGDDAASLSDDARSSMLAATQTKKKGLNEIISTTLKDLPAEKKIPISPVTDELKVFRDRLDKDLRFEERGQIDKIIERLESKGDSVTPKEMFDIKNYLQDVASSAYNPNAIFQVGTEASNAAKKGAAIARKAVNVASPTIAEANNTLAKLHLVEDKMNKNLLTPGASDAAFYSAGSGTNKRGEKSLKQLGDIVGEDFVKKSQVASTSKELGDAGLLPKDFTGKAVARMAPSATAGTVALGPVGALIGPILSSPKAFRQYFKTGAASADIIRRATGYTGELTDKAFDSAYRYLQTPEGQNRFANALRGTRALGTLDKEDKK